MPVDNSDAWEELAPKLAARLASTPDTVGTPRAALDENDGTVPDLMANLRESLGLPRSRPEANTGEGRAAESSNGRKSGS